MILLVHHHADGLAAVHHSPASGAFCGMFATDEMTLDEDLLLNRGQLCHFLREGILHLRQLFENWPDRIHHDLPVFFFRPTRERVAYKIPCQSNATRHHDVAFGTGGPHPFSRFFQKGGESHQEREEL
jgi:hypothetical protein